MTLAYSPEFYNVEFGIPVLDYRAVRAAFPDYAGHEHDRDSWQWYLTASGALPSAAFGGFDATYEPAGGVLLSNTYGVGYTAGESAGRVYYELFDGVHDEDTIRGLWLRIGTGGLRARAERAEWRYSIYGRDHLSGPNLVLLRRAQVRRYGPFDEWGTPIGTWPLWNWRNVYMPIPASPGVRCIVVKLECVSDYQRQGAVAGWDDADELGAHCPHGVRLKAATVYASDLGRNVTAPRVLKDIVEPYYPDATTPASTLQYDQIAYSELPRDRWDAVDDVVAMNGWDYAVWDGDALAFTDPDDAEPVSIPKSHAGVKWTNGPDESDAFNAVRVQYTSKRGKPREVILHGKLKLGGDVVADTITAPDSVVSKAGAERVARRWLKAHGRVPNVGDITVTGIGPWGDALKLRPGCRVGREKVGHVTLSPLDWSATLQFGVNVDSYEAWIARLAAGASPKKR